MILRDPRRPGGRQLTILARARQARARAPAVIPQMRPEHYRRLGKIMETRGAQTQARHLAASLGLAAGASRLGTRAAESKGCVAPRLVARTRGVAVTFPRSFEGSPSLAHLNPVRALAREIEPQVRLKRPAGCRLCGRFDLV